jgi:hypothetical protein
MTIVMTDGRIRPLYGNPLTSTSKKKPGTSSVAASSSFSPFGRKRS